MAAKIKNDESKADTYADPLVMTISEINKLSDEEKQAFRQAGGTTIEG